MIDGRKIVAEARKWIGTPFHHQARVIGVGVDCAGVLIGVAKSLSYQHHDVSGYSKNPFKQQLRENLEMDVEKISEVEDGCILLMSFDADPQHVAIYNHVDDTIIHALAAQNSCVEHRLDSRWKSRIVAKYRFKEGAQ